MKTFSVWLIALIKLYQLIIAPIFVGLGVRCRFEPSCSRYAIQAVETHGFVRGVILAVWRVGRCHPFCMGGADPVPQKFSILKCTKETNG